MAKTAHRLTFAAYALLVALAPFRAAAAQQGQWTDLFNGRNLDGWILTDPKRSSWKVLDDGVVDNSPMPSCDIYTEKWFGDFEAEVEFAVYPRSNAGLYLLGRYEIQILDSFGREKPGTSDCGALYREVAPRVNASKPPLQWQTFEIKLRAARFDADGRKTGNGSITLIHNGQLILDNVEFEEPTGSRKQYNEEATGPILIQGDHGAVKFRKFRVRGGVYDMPAKDSPGPEILGPALEPKAFPVNQAKGFELGWRTPNHAYAPVYRVYRGASPGFPIDREHLFDTSSAKRSFEDCRFETDGVYYYRVVALGLGGVPGPASEVISARAAANQVETPVLSEASWALVKGNDVPRRDAAQNRKTMTMAGKTYKTGIGMRSPSSILMHVGKMVGDNDGWRLRATIGLDGSIRSAQRDKSAGRFIVQLDDKIVFRSDPMQLSDGIREVDVLIPAGTRRLELATESAGPRGWDYCNWANARLERAK